MWYRWHRKIARSKPNCYNASHATDMSKNSQALNVEISLFTVNIYVFPGHSYDYYWFLVSNGLWCIPHHCQYIIYFIINHWHPLYTFIPFLVAAWGTNWMCLFILYPCVNRNVVHTSFLLVVVIIYQLCNLALYYFIVLYIFQVAQSFVQPRQTTELHYETLLSISLFPNRIWQPFPRECFGIVLFAVLFYW